MGNHGPNVCKTYSESTFKGWDGWLVGWKPICRFTHLSRKTLIPLIKNHELPVYSLPGGTVMAIPEMLNYWILHYTGRQEEAGGRRVGQGEFRGVPNTGLARAKQGPPGRDRGEGKGAGAVTERRT